MLTHMEKHFTSTVFIFFKNKTLLHFHKKIQKWLPPGGHIEQNETPVEAAKREVLEETHIEVDLFSQENIWIDTPNAKSIEKPFLCLLETIEQPVFHQHIDFIYLAKPRKDPSIYPAHSSFQWMSYEDICLIEEEKIFPDTKQIIEKFLETNFLENALTK